MNNIKNVINKLSKNKIIDFIIIVMIACIISIPLKNVQITLGTHDGAVHFVRLRGVISAINIKQFPPLIAPDLCMSSGYAMMLFYNPIVTYIPLFIFILIKEYFLSLKLYAAICILISGITMYRFSYQITNKRSTALISAVLYMNVPYLLGNIYVRYAMGEFTALAFMPIVFMGLYSLINQDGKKHYLILVGAILIVLSHTVTSMYLAGLCFIYLIINIRKLKNKEIIKKLVLNILFILIITMFFWIPIFEAKNSTEYGIFDDYVMGTRSDFVSKEAISIKDFFVDVDDYKMPIVLIGLPTLFFGALTIYAYRKVDEHYKKTYITFLIFSLILLFMTTEYFPWKNIPDFLCKLQFPWRFLGYFGFFSSIVCAINVNIVLDRITSKKLIKIITFMLIFIFIITYSLNILYKNIIKQEIYTDYSLYNYFNNQEIFLNILNTEYLPKTLMYKKEYLDYIKNRAKSNSIVLYGKAEIIDEHKENLSLTLAILNANKDTEIEFPFIFYPGYEIELYENGKFTKLNYIISENGYVAIKIDKDLQNAELKVEYKGTTLTKVSYIISFVGLLGYIIYIYLEDNKFKQNTTQISENVLK